jgi:replicative DNA helicase
MSNTISTNDLYSLEAEAELLGMLIQDKNKLDNIVFRISSEHFYLTPHGIIYDTIKNLINNNKNNDILTLDNVLNKEDWYKDLGGKNYLTRLQQTLSYSTIRGRAELIRSLYTKRKFIDICKNGIEQAMKSSFLEIADSITSFESELYNITKENKSQQDVPVPNIIDKIMDKLDVARQSSNVMSGIASGYKALDDMLCGFKNGELTIIGARPSIGKTAFSSNILYNMAKNGCAVGMFSIEMSAEAILKRIISLHADINSRSLDSGRYIEGIMHGKPITDADFKKLKKKLEDTLKGYPIYVNEKSTINIQEVYSQTRTWIKKHNIKALMVDYVQIVKSANKNKNTQRYIEIGEITAGLKAIAKDFDIPVIALAQIGRESDKREDKRPKMSDLKESGSLEQDADIIILLHREAFHLEKDKPEESKPVRESGESLDNFGKRLKKYTDWEEKYKLVENKAELSIAKNRNGLTGNIELCFDKSKTKFSDVKQQLTVTKETKHVKQQLTITNEAKQIDRADWDDTNPPF